MAKRTGSKLGWIVVGVALTYGGYRAVDAAFSSDAADDHVANQLWLGKLPKTDRDIVEHLVLIDHDNGRFGAWGRSSAWLHNFEVFKWAREKDRLLLFFPQTRKRGKAKVRAWKCEGDAPKPFQLCLEITRDGDTALYYSREDWVIEPGNVAESLEDIAEDTPELDGHLDEVADVDLVDG